MKTAVREISTAGKFQITSLELEQKKSLWRVDPLSLKSEFGRQPFSLKKEPRAVFPKSASGECQKNRVIDDNGCIAKYRLLIASNNIKPGSIGMIRWLWITSIRVIYNPAKQSSLQLYKAISGRSEIALTESSANLLLHSSRSVPVAAHLGTVIIRIWYRGNLFPAMWKRSIPYFSRCIFILTIPKITSTGNRQRLLSPPFKSIEKFLYSILIKSTTT